MWLPAKGSQDLQKIVPKAASFILSAFYIGHFQREELSAKRHLANDLTRLVDTWTAEDGSRVASHQEQSILRYFLDNDRRAVWLARQKSRNLLEQTRPPLRFHFCR